MQPQPELAARLYLPKGIGAKGTEGFAKEAKSSYQIAKELDPFNPVIKLMAGVYE